MSGSVLALNTGSSSLKFALFGADPRAPAFTRGSVEQAEGCAHLLALDAMGEMLLERHWPVGSAQTTTTELAAVLAFVDGLIGACGLAAVGHRIVHGGEAHVAPALVTPALLADLDALVPLDPLHMPAGLAQVRRLAADRPELMQVACFDTAFHHAQPAVATRLALPRAITEAGVRRYGFHGLSYEYVAGHLEASALHLAKGRVIAAHLGSGASLCALSAGRSVATTTGFSTLDGLMMATRCGTLDAGAVLYLLRQGHDVADLEDMLYRRSGLLGVSGLSGDVRALLASREPHAREAIELYTYRIAMEAGGLVSALGGLDGLVFTAGVGEHVPAVRMEVCARLAWLGVMLDEAANAAGAAVISAPDSRVEVRIVPTDEEAMIARHTHATLDAQPHAQRAFA